MSAALPTPPPPPAPPAPPGVESPPSAPGPGLVVGGASHGSHRRRGGGLRPPSLLHPARQGQAQAQPATRVVVNAAPTQPKANTSAAGFYHALRQQQGASQGAALGGKALGRGPAPRARVPRTAAGRGRAAQTARAAAQAGAANAPVSKAPLLPGAAGSAALKQQVAAVNASGAAVPPPQAAPSRATTWMDDGKGNAIQVYTDDGSPVNP